MKTIIKGLLWVSLWFLAAFLLGSCEPGLITIPNTEQVIIDIDNEEFYTFSDLNVPSMGWIEKDNGDGYSFTIENGKATLTSGKQILTAKYYIGTMDRVGKELEITSKNTVKSELHPYGVFVIKY